MNKAAGVALHMSRAAENLQAARKLLGEGHFGISASRAYYAMFYAAEAALLHRDLQFSRHSAVMSFFDKEFVKPGVFRPKAFKALQGAYDKRIQGTTPSGPSRRKMPRECSPRRRSSSRR